MCRVYQCSAVAVAVIAVAAVAVANCIVYLSLKDVLFAVVTRAAVALSLLLLPLSVISPKG